MCLGSAPAAPAPPPPPPPPRACLSAARVTPGETPIVTTVHPTQLVDGVLSAALDEWDVPLDLICCPGEVIRTQTALPQPTKTVSWSAVRPDQFRDIPFLTELRREMDGLFAHDNS